MSAYYFENLPRNLQNSFWAVRSTSDNLYNLLQVLEIILSCNDSRVNQSSDFDLAIFTGSYNRVLVRKPDGYFTMNFPFKIEDQGENLLISYDIFHMVIDLRIISMLRNAIQTCKIRGYTHEEIILSLHYNFSVPVKEAIEVCDTFISLISEDHGYFRFDDDPVNQNGNIHPRFHFDFFFKNTSSVKLGTDLMISHEFFYPLFDISKEKYYVRR
ncbi:hypothetical protein [Providencia sp. PROV221]|uniref:hypothetical protein n=1 Tax=Providencia sp. PROV221 TaxID=2949916 RepID=UPI002348EED3|nr:hypothetical protein [Providencia sp. PROV221]